LTTDRGAAPRLAEGQNRLVWEEWLADILHDFGCLWYRLYTRRQRQLAAVFMFGRTGTEGLRSQRPGGPPRAGGE
jgi:hypothetical protein